jgi:hypothetical protein
LVNNYVSEAKSTDCVRSQKHSIGSKKHTFTGKLLSINSSVCHDHVQYNTLVDRLLDQSTLAKLFSASTLAALNKRPSNHKNDPRHSKEWGA